MQVLSRMNTKQLTGRRALIASLIGAAATAACAQVAFYLPGNPIPVTLQVFAVACCGMLLGSRLGALSQAQYLAAGAAGAPVFAGFKGGYLALAGPTGGYLVGFVAAAFVIGLITERMELRSLTTTVMAGLTGVAVIYILGRAWFGVWLGDISGLRSWLWGVAPFVGLDVAKVTFAAALCIGRRSEQRW